MSDNSYNNTAQIIQPTLVVAIATISVLMASYLVFRQSKLSNTKIFYKSNSPTAQKFIDNCKSLDKPFTPSLLFQTPLLQTLVSSILPLHKQVASHTEHLKDLQVQGRAITGISLSHCYLKEAKDKKSNSEGNTLAFVLPGLTGNIGDSYINNMAYELLQAGHQVIVYNYRLLSITHVMDEKKIDLVEDLHLVLQLIKKRNPDKILFGVGHSYGANQLVNYLGRHGEQSILRGGVSIANPYNMTVCSNLIRGTIYNYMVARILARQLAKSQEVFWRAPAALQLEVKKALKAKQVYQFDEAVTIKIYHYDSVDKYYEDFSSSKRIAEVKVPLLCLSAADDPVAFAQAIPLKEIQNNDQCLLVLTGGGGHVGWVETRWGLLPSLKQWHFKLVVEFLDHLRNSHCQ